MKIITTVLTGVATVAIAAIGLIAAPTASAAYVTIGKFGIWEQLGCCGGTVTAWKVEDLKPSAYTVPDYPLHGHLWQATASVRAVRGTVTPLIPDLSARADNGQNYQVIWQAFTPETISGKTLAQGRESTGLLLFDVTGAPPTWVAYNNLIQDLIVWEK